MNKLVCLFSLFESIIEILVSRNKISTLEKEYVKVLVLFYFILFYFPAGVLYKGTPEVSKFIPYTSFSTALKAIILKPFEEGR